MAVSREKYEALVAKEMRRFGRGFGTGGESGRDKAVRAANVAAGYGNSTALKYPVKAGGGGRTLRRDGDGDGKAGEGDKTSSTGGGGGGGKGGGGGGGANQGAGPGRGSSKGGPSLFPQMPPRLNGLPIELTPPEMMAGPEGVPPDLVRFQPNMVRPEFGPGGLPRARPSMVRPEGPVGALPAANSFVGPTDYGPQQELPGRPEDFDQGTGDLPYSRLPDRSVLGMGGAGSVGREGAPYAPFGPGGMQQPPQDVGFIQKLLQSLRGG